MPTGRIKFFDLKKGFGFITHNETDFYVRTVDIQGLDRPLKQGDLVDFDSLPASKPGKSPRAVRVKFHDSRRNRRTEDQTADQPKFELLRKAKEESASYLKQAQEARSKKEYDRARTLYVRALEKQVSQGAFLAYGSMERELAQGGNYERASRVYENAIREFPNDGKLYEDYGMLYLRANPARAIEIFRQGLEKDPQHKALHRHLGHALYATKDPAVYSQAEHQFNLAEQGGMLDGSARLERGLVKIMRGIPRGKLSLTFLDKASFEVKTVTSHNPAIGFDLIARAVHPSYQESYDLSEGLWFRCLFKNRLVNTDVQEFLKKVSDPQTIGPEVNRDVIFLIAQNVTNVHDHLRRLLEQPGKHPTIVPIDSSLMESVVTSATPIESFKQHLDDWLYKRNLYEETFPVSGRRFFGREQQLAGLIRSIEAGSAVGLFGLRKVGKTSLLKRLKEKRPADLAVYIDLQAVPEGVKEANYVYWLVGNHLSEELASKYPTLSQLVAFKLAGKYTSFHDIKKPESIPSLFDSDLRVLTGLIRSNMTRPFKILIMFDEVERLLPVGRSEGFRGYDSLFAYIRGISQANDLITSIVTGANPAICDTAQWEGRDNPVFKFYHEMFLPPLEPRECAEMVERLGRGMGVTYTPNSLDRIYRETGGHPFVTRQLCSRISKYFKDRPLKVDVPKVEVGAAEFLFHDSDFFKEIMERLQRDFPIEKDLLLFIASGVDKERALIELVRDTRDSLRHLVGYELVDRQGETFRIKLDLFSTWIRKYWLNENK